MCKTVCVIGSGIGGLTAGAILANKGYNVTVLEKATTVGGSAGWYFRKGRIFPTGATIAFGLEEHGLLSTIYKEIKLNPDVEMLQHPMDVILQDRKISIYQDVTRWDKELSNTFSERKEDVKRFWEELERISRYVHEFTATGVSMPIQRLYDLGNLPRYALTHPGSIIYLARYATWTVEDLLRKYKLQSYEPLRQFLDAQLIDAAQIDCSKAALLPSSLALTIYRRGSYHIKNGMGQLCHALAERIIELGGKVILSSPVKKIKYDKKEAVWHVDSRKLKETFQFVINNSGISFGEGTSHSEEKLFSWGAFRIDALLKDKFWQKELQEKDLPFALQIVPDKENTELFSVAHGPVYVTFQPSQDRNHELVDGEITMSCSIHVHLGDWVFHSKEEYEAKKQQFTDRIFSEIQRVINVKDYLLYAEAGTPLTYERFIGKSDVGGFPLTVRNAILKPNSTRLTLPQLYIVGEQTFPGPGTLSSALSGYYAARAIAHA